MPRRTHPNPRNKHSRAHIRYQRRRYIGKRWRAAKRVYGDDFWLSRRLSETGPVPSEHYELRHRLRQVDPMVFVHPEVARRFPTWLWWARQWPFSLEPGRFARNPFNTCDCWDCGGGEGDDPPRARGEGAGGGGGGGGGGRGGGGGGNR